MLFINARLIFKDHFLPDAWLEVKNGIITAFGSMDNVPESTEIINCNNNNLLPGFIDIHTHAVDNIAFFEDPESAAKAAIKYGVTSILATIAYSVNFEKTMKAIELFNKAKQNTENLLGINMEGPFMNPKYGGHPERNEWAGKCKPEVYMPLLKSLGDRVKIFSVAPETDNIRQFMADAKKENPNVIFSVGHTDASAEATEELFCLGVKLATHITNAMFSEQVNKGCARPGAVEALLDSKDVFAEVICDSLGIHVTPFMLRYLRRQKTDDRLILITDGSKSDAENPENLKNVTDLNFDRNGLLSGSKLTMDKACRNMMMHTGASLVEISKLASYNPAKLLGLCDRGEIKVGCRADLILADDRLNISEVYIEGKKQ